jgi:hypothetical protein
MTISSRNGSRTNRVRAGLRIPLCAKHRLENPGKLPLRLIEVQSGPYLGEDNIVRFEDTYGRIHRRRLGSFRRVVVSAALANLGDFFVVAELQYLSHQSRNWRIEMGILRWATSNVRLIKRLGVESRLLHRSDHLTGLLARMERGCGYENPCYSPPQELLRKA